MPLSVIELDEIDRLFSRKNWQRSTTLHGEIFDQLCEALSTLTESERRLIVELTEQFLWCTPNISAELCAGVIDQITAVISAHNLPVHLVGLIKPADFGKVKSAGMISYLLEPLLKRAAAAHARAYRSYDRPDRLPDASRRTKPGIFVFVDDYVGSGETALKTIAYFEQRKKIKGDVVLIACLVAQHLGAKEVSKTVDAFVAGEYRGKGIGDANLSIDRERAYEIMREIEEEISVAENYRLGFGQTEGLVCMYRCPNNTFPFYWHSGSKNPAMRRAKPFER